MSSIALNYVMNLLSRREYSEFEIRCKMQEKAFSEEEINTAIAHCQQKNWQNDARFTENYLYSRAQRGYGIQRIKQELKQLKGISASVIDEGIAECHLDWSQIARDVLRKKFPQYTQKLDIKTKQKIWRYMLSHGFYSEDFSDLIELEDQESFY